MLSEMHELTDQELDYVIGAGGSSTGGMGGGDNNIAGWRFDAAGGTSNGGLIGGGNNIAGWQPPPGRSL